MKLSTLVCVAWIGIATPAIALSIAPMSAIARQMPQPQGFFSDRDWSISMDLKGGSYNYHGRNNLTGSKLDLAGASISGTNSRRVYTWNNSGTRYRITWQPADPGTIRLQVIAPNGKEQLNRLLYAEDDC
jgi:hypothetical protein